jgi:hypothetical protein
MYAGANMGHPLRDVGCFACSTAANGMHSLLLHCGNDIQRLSNIGIAG